MDKFYSSYSKLSKRNTVFPETSWECTSTTSPPTTICTSTSPTWSTRLRRLWLVRHTCWKRLSTTLRTWTPATIRRRRSRLLWRSWAPSGRSFGRRKDCLSLASWLLYFCVHNNIMYKYHFNSEKQLDSTNLQTKVAYKEGGHGCKWTLGFWHLNALSLIDYAMFCLWCNDFFREVNLSSPGLQDVLVRTVLLA